MEVNLEQENIKLTNNDNLQCWPQRSILIKASPEWKPVVIGSLTASSEDH